MLINIEIDNQKIVVDSETTILEAARKLGVNIPTLCHMNLPHMKVDHAPSSCRICVVEVEGKPNLLPACSTKCWDQMKIRSSSMLVLNARKVVMEMILSNHPKDCLVCAKSGRCDLQHMASHLGIRQVRGSEYALENDYSLDISQAIIRDPNKCIVCRRCETMCNQIQTVGALYTSFRGFDTIISPAFNLPLDQTSCTYCGQCVAVCPTGALTERDHSQDIVRHLSNPQKVVVVQTAPAVRVALGEEFGMPVGEVVTGKMVTALRRLGFDYVFDTDFAADLTIMEESAEILDRLQLYSKGDTTVRLPILTSCCPAWVNFFETYYPDMLDVPSSAKSPQQMFGAIVKHYLAPKLGISPSDMIVVSVMPCLAKKYECSRPEFSGQDKVPDVDYSISTREFARLIKESNINFSSLEDGEFDDPLGESSGAGVLFATTGGVMEAALRTAYELHTKKELPELEFNEVRGLDGVRYAEVNFNDIRLNVGIAHGLGNARRLLDAVRSKKLELHIIEIMACPGGCIGGGGQPLHHGDESVLRKRQNAIYAKDKEMKIRKSHKNPSIIKLYTEFLGAPLSPLAHELLHTRFYNK